MDLIEDKSRDVEEKIRQALQGPSHFAPDDIVEAKLPRVIEKKTLTFSQLARLFVIAFFFSSFYLVRTDPSINLIISGVILKSEKALGSDLSMFKTIFGVRMKLNADEFDMAVNKGSVVLASVLLDWGLDPNSLSPTGDTILITAIKQKRTEIVSVLLAKGANVNLPNSKNEFPLEFALSSSDLVTQLVKSGADINGRDLSQKTYLIKAVLKKDIALIKDLIKAGADPNLQDSSGKTALHYAVESKNEEIILYLQSVGADQNIFDKSGRKAIFVKEPVIDKEQPKQETWWQEPKSQPTVAQSSERSARTVIQSSNMTAVRVMGKVTGVFERSKQVVLREVSAEVRNVGDVTANSVRVRVKVPGGAEIDLSGPASVPPYTTVKFKAEPGVAVNKSGDLRATASCENCHK